MPQAHLVWSGCSQFQSLITFRLFFRFSTSAFFSRSFFFSRSYFPLSFDLFCGGEFVIVYAPPLRIVGVTSGETLCERSLV